MTFPRQIKGWLNPLMFPDMDAPGLVGSDIPPTAESFLRFLCPSDQPLDMAALVVRYREIDPEPRRLFLVPAESRLLTKLMGPLRHAKGSYVTGNYLATISLSGMVAEMIAILMWDISSHRQDSAISLAQREKLIPGGNFEGLVQDRRVKALFELGLITEATRADFGEIRQIRRRYLHLSSQDHGNLAADAVKCYHRAVSLAVEVIGQDVQDDQIVLKPDLLAYLMGQGFLSATPFVLEGGQGVLPEDIVGEGLCRCSRVACVGHQSKVYCVWTRELSPWVLGARLYRRCYDEQIECPRCGAGHKRGHIGKREMCLRPFTHQDAHSD